MEEESSSSLSLFPVVAQLEQQVEELSRQVQEVGNVRQQVPELFQRAGELTKAFEAYNVLLSGIRREIHRSEIQAEKGQLEQEQPWQFTTVKNTLGEEQEKCELHLRLSLRGTCPEDVRVTLTEIDPMKGVWAVWWVFIYV